MIDIHTHLLPGVDDGARTMDESVEVLRRLASQGVTTLVCTPHLKASRAFEAPRARNDALLAELRARMGGAIDLRLGWEIMLDRPGQDLSSGVLRLAGSSSVLVEFPHSGVPPRSAFELARLRESGVVPVLAHPERYMGASVWQVREWRSAGAVMQGDATYLLGSGDRGRLARALLEEGLIDLLSSDNHGDQRSLRAARDWLTEMGATEHAELLTGGNAGRVLNDDMPLPVPPLSLPRGFAARLRELLFGRRG
ncbi:MAG TPA: CpsB/CapC family capsule biosynthesis tyrosine phosphatase [Gemmatimonadales bacterium]